MCVFLFSVWLGLTPLSRLLNFYQVREGSLSSRYWTFFFSSETPQGFYFIQILCISVVPQKSKQHTNLGFFLNPNFLFFKYMYVKHIWATSWQNQQNDMCIRPVWSVFAVCLKKALVHSYPLCAQRRLIRLGGCPGWSESSLGTHTILLVLSGGGSFVEQVTLKVICGLWSDSNWTKTLYAFHFCILLVLVFQTVTLNRWQLFQ